MSQAVGTYCPNSKHEKKLIDFWMQVMTRELKVLNGGNHAAGEMQKIRFQNNSIQGSKFNRMKLRNEH